MAPSSQQGTVFEPVAVRSPWFGVLLALIAVVALIGPAFYIYDVYGYSTLAYHLRPDGLQVRYGFIALRIPAAEIDAVRLVAEPGRLRRVEGVGLPQIQRGWWTVEGEGRVYRLTTVGRNMALVETSAAARVARPATRYLFSPEDPERFVALLEAARRSAAAPGSLPSVPPAGVMFLPVRAAAGHPATDPVNLLLAAELLFVGVIPFLLWYGRRSLRYRVADGIYIRHLFGEHRLEWACLRDVRRIEGPLRGVRTLGTAMPGYYAGGFHLRTLGGVRVYATDLRRRPLVLIEHRPGGKVIISPEDVEGFLAAVARARGRMQGEGRGAGDARA